MEIAKWWRRSKGHALAPKFAGAPARWLASLCWACSFHHIADVFPQDRRRLGPLRPQRAHIVAHSRGGTNDASNFLLLCKVCHREQPDGLDRETQIRWAVAHRPRWELNQELADRILAAVVAEEPDPEVRAAYMEAVRRRGPDYLGDILTGRGIEYASTRSSNVAANQEWAIVADLRRWRQTWADAAAKLKATGGPFGCRYCGASACVPKLPGTCSSCGAQLTTIVTPAVPDRILRELAARNGVTLGEEIERAELPPYVW